MATIEAGVYDWLSGRSAVTDETTNIYPQWVPRGKSLPYITLQLIFQDRPRYQEGVSGLVYSLVQIDCWGTTFKQAADLSEIVRDNMDGYRGTMGTHTIRRVTLEDTRSLVTPPRAGDDEDTPRISMDFGIWHTETVPTF